MCGPIDEAYCPDMTINRTILTGIFSLALAACGAPRESAVRETPLTEQSLAAGTRVTATIQDSLTSRSNRKGDTLHAIVAANVNGPRGGVVIPAGSNATVTVVTIEPGTDPKNPEGSLALVVSSVTVNGVAYPVAGVLEAVPHHLQVRATSTAQAPGGRDARRDVIVSAGTPIVFSLTNSLLVAAK